MSSHTDVLQAVIQSRIFNGGVGERLKPAVLKNKIVVSLSDRKYN
jgi:hypothetical protein